LSKFEGRYDRCVACFTMRVKYFWSHHWNASISWNANEQTQGAGGFLGVWMMSQSSCDCERMGWLAPPLHSRCWKSLHAHVPQNQRRDVLSTLLLNLPVASKSFISFFSEVGQVFGYIPFDKTRHFCVVPAEVEELSLLSCISPFHVTRRAPSGPSARQHRDGGHHWTFTDRDWATRCDLNAFAGTLVACVLQTRLQFAVSGSWRERGGRVFRVTQSGRTRTYGTGM